MRYIFLYALLVVAIVGCNKNNANSKSPSVENAESVSVLENEEAASPSDVVDGEETFEIPMRSEENEEAEYPKNNEYSEDDEFRGDEEDEFRGDEEDEGEFDEPEEEEDLNNVDPQEEGDEIW